MGSLGLSLGSSAPQLLSLVLLVCFTATSVHAEDKMAAGAAAHERTQGDKALMEGRLKEALKHFESAVKMNPDDHMNYYKRATAYMIDKYGSAIKDLDKVLEMKPGYAQALDKRAKIYSNEGKFKEARLDYETLLNAKKGDAELQKKVQDLHMAEQMQGAASQLMAGKNWGGARDHLNRAIDVAPDCVALLLARAECHMMLGERENVLADTGKALKSQSTNMAALELSILRYV